MSLYYNAYTGQIVGSIQNRTDSIIPKRFYTSFFKTSYMPDDENVFYDSDSSYDIQLQNVLESTNVREFVVHLK